MKYHVFTRKFGNYISNSDNCSYCNENAGNLFNKLSSKMQKHLSNDLITLNHTKYSKVLEYYLSKYIICENGLSEKEYIIKELLE